MPAPFTQLAPTGTPGQRYSFSPKAIGASGAIYVAADTRPHIKVTVGARPQIGVAVSTRQQIGAEVGTRA